VIANGIDIADIVIFTIRGNYAQSPGDGAVGRIEGIVVRKTLELARGLYKEKRTFSHSCFVYIQLCGMT
jgi:hypothetical protein